MKFWSMSLRKKRSEAKEQGGDVRTGKQARRPGWEPGAGPESQRGWRSWSPESPAEMLAPVMSGRPGAGQCFSASRFSQTPSDGAAQSITSRTKVWSSLPVQTVDRIFFSGFLAMLLTWSTVSLRLPRWS